MSVIGIAGDDTRRIQPGAAFQDVDPGGFREGSVFGRAAVRINSEFGKKKKVDARCVMRGARAE